MDHQRFVGTDEDIRELMLQRESKRPEQRTAHSVSPIPRHKSGERFVRGPIPWQWLRLALSIEGKSGNLAFALWYLAGLTKANPIRLTSKILTEFGVSSKTATRLLLAFKAKGLVDVDRQRGRGPDVTILDPCKRKGD